MAGGQCSEQGPRGQAAGLWDQWQEGLPLQGHHTHHIQAILSEGACLQGARGQPGGEAWDALCPAGLGAHTPGQMGPLGGQEPELGPEEGLSLSLGLGTCGSLSGLALPSPCCFTSAISSRKASLILRLGQGSWLWAPTPGLFATPSMLTAVLGSRSGQCDC